MAQWECLTPFMKQCFVTAGVSMNVAGTAMVMAYTTGLLPQLKHPDSKMSENINESVGSWIASTPAISLILGNIAVPFLMSSYGRKSTNITSILFLLIGWLCITLAYSITAIIIGRVIQGISIGITLTLSPILIAEYTSPKNRGAFLMSMSVLSSIYVLIIHTLGSNFTWHTNALVSLAITALNLPIVIYSPESPTWLLSKERYDDCKHIFRWLRGVGEENELKAMIKASDVARNSKLEGAEMKVKLKTLVTKIDFYKSVLTMVHLYALGQWAGINALATYTNDIFENVIGKDTNIGINIAVLDAQRIVSNIIAIYIIKKIKRRTMLFSMSILNIVALLAIAVYTFSRTKGLLPFDYPTLGVILIHIHMFAVASGTLPLPFIIAGEIFPTEYKSIAGGISIMSFALNFFAAVKTLPYLFRTVGMHGAYFLYAAVVTYCLLVAWKLMPETKDRTLQDIEDKLMGKPVVEDSRAICSLINK